MHTIPLIDLREKTLVDLCTLEQARARRLIADSRTIYGVVSRALSHLALPLGDHLAKRWLEKTDNPYRQEIAEYANVLKVKGVYALNLSYEWGCTSGVFNTSTGPQLLRVLDWPFPGLGEATLVALQQSPAGEYYNITWPGISGIIQAMAPGRFAVAINQAPMRRHKTGIVLDWLRNRRHAFRQQGLPPAHLLRKTFETCQSYQAAKQMLTNTPVALPVIYVVSGAEPGEGCVIERLENDAIVHELGARTNVVATNHFVSHLNATAKGWLPRAIDSRGRAELMSGLTAADIEQPGCQWFKPPIANPLSRMVLQTNAKTGAMQLTGTAGMQAVTQQFVR